jgi:hypothetical protein
MGAARSLLAGGDMGSRFCFFYLLLTAACSSSLEIESTTQALCDCEQHPELCCCNSPILLDVAGNGFELTSLDDGVRVATRPGYQQTERAWTNPGSDDAWLVLDRNDDGVINDMSEMFGNTTPQPEPHEGQWRNGFLALVLYDNNADGIIDESDPIFGSLRLWQDKNHDGVSQPDELHKLPERGVAGISVAYTEARRGDGHGNLFLYTASVYGTPGSTVGKDAWDVWLSGVQSMPIPGAAADEASPRTGGTAAAQSHSSTAALSSTTGYFTCDAECASEAKSCALGPSYGSATGGGDDQDPIALLAVQACHAALPDRTYCSFDPVADQILQCTASSFLEWTCLAACAEERNNVPSPECPSLIEVTGTSTSRSQAQRNAIAACDSQATANFCDLAVNSSDRIYDSPDDVIDNVIVSPCVFHPTGGGGGGGGC